jgi:hypothetical protein
MSERVGSFFSCTIDISTRDMKISIHNKYSQVELQGVEGVVSTHQSCKCRVIQ